MRFVASATLAASVLAGTFGGVAAAGNSTSTTHAASGSSGAPSSSTTTTTTPNAITWGIQPSTAHGPTGKAAFVYDNITPGSRIRSYVAVTNYSKVPVTFVVYAEDAVNTTTGGFDVLRQGQKSTGVGAWITLARSTITVPAGTNDNIPFTLQIPTNATPGDHYGGIVAQVTTGTTNTKGDKFLVNRRVGARVYLRVVGHLHPSLTIENLSLGYGGTVNPVGSGTVTVTYVVKNTGNMALAASQLVTVTSLFGTLASTTPRPIVNLVPGQSQDVKVTLDGVPPAGPIRANVALVPTVPRGTTTLPNPKLEPPLAAIRRSAGTWAWPWSQLVLLVLFVALLWLWGTRGRRRKKKQQAALVAAKEEGRRQAEAELKEKAGEEKDETSAADGAGPEVLAPTGADQEAADQ